MKITKVSATEIAYAKYEAYCVKLGIKPASQKNYEGVAQSLSGSIPGVRSKPVTANHFSIFQDPAPS